ncbi:MAG: hypothetical protein KatS3mg131_0384 [Candidatus Tectimicrobiota bacterium]|nr:MAG: hypothetical protein KatS3mg131_0384 [Candidatus Tectomicrobia bacterium]
MQQRLEDSQELLADLLERPGLVSLLAGINREISKALVAHLTGGLLGAEGAAGPAAGTQTQNVSFLTALFTEMAQVLAAPASYVYRSPWGRFFLDEDDLWASDGYLTAQGGRLLFVLVEGRPATGFVKHAAPLQALRAHLRAVQQEFPEVEAGVTGGNALAADEMLVSQRDMQLATGLALLGVAVLFILTFREVRRPLLVVATLVVAVAWSLGFTTLTVGHLNILSVAFTPILIGLGIDFGIHLLARYAEERARGAAFAPALEAAYRLTGPGVIMAALTTALAFYAVMLTNFRGLAELGFIAGSGVLLCLLASWTVLPALLALSERQRPGRVGIWQPQPLDPLRPLRRYPRTVLAGLGLVTLAGVVWLPKPQFDYNLLRLQARGTESVVWEHRLLAEAERSSWYAVSRATSLPELYRKQEAFRALPVVERVESLASLLPPDQPQRLQRVAALAPYVEPLHGKWDEAEPVDLEELALLLDKIRFKLQRPPAEWDPRQRPSEAQLRAAREALLAVQDHLQRLPAAQAQAALERLQQLLLADMADKLSLLRRNVHPTPVTLDDIPPLLRQRFVSPEGTYLLRIFARDNIWEREPMAAFVTQLQAVDPEVSGPPVVAYEAIRQMQRGLHARWAVCPGGDRGPGRGLLPAAATGAILFGASAGGGAVDG